MSLCRVISCVVGSGCLLWPFCSLGKYLLAFAMLHSVLQGQTCLLFQVSLDFLLFHSCPQRWKWHTFVVLVLEGLADLHRTVQLLLFGISAWGIDLDYCDIEWLDLETNWGQPVVSVIVPKYYILDSFVDSEGYSISSKGFLPTIVGIMVNWIKFARPILFSSLIPKMSVLTLATSVWPLPVYLSLWMRHSGFLCSIALIASDSTLTTGHIHNWVLFPPWLSLVILTGAISPLVSSSILDTYQPEGFIFQGHIYLPFHTVHGVLNADMICYPHLQRTTFFQNSVMTPLTWAALLSIAHSFIKLHNAVIPMIILVSFLWLWFSFCLSSMDEYKRCVPASWWEGLALGKTRSCSCQWGHAH